jgi:hypothetical protein
LSWHDDYFSGGIIIGYQFIPSLLTKPGPRAICVIATPIDADILIRALEIVIGEPVTAK